MQEREKESVVPEERGGGRWLCEDSQSECSEGWEPAGGSSYPRLSCPAHSLYSLQISLISHNWTNTRVTVITHHPPPLSLYLYCSTKLYGLDLSWWFAPSPTQYWYWWWYCVSRCFLWRRGQLNLVFVFLLCSVLWYLVFIVGLFLSSWLTVPASLALAVVSLYW